MACSSLRLVFILWMMASEAKSQKYDGSAILKNLKHDFDMNVQFQLRKLGIDLVTMSDRMVTTPRQKRKDPARVWTQVPNEEHPRDKKMAPNLISHAIVNGTVDIVPFNSTSGVNLTNSNNPTKTFLDSYLMVFGYLSGVSNSTKCFGQLGCIEITEDWYGLSRPVNSLPQDREKINTQFILYTKDTLELPEILNSSDLGAMMSTAFDASRDTKLIIHGFLDTGFVPWVKELAKGLLDNGDFNIISVDWGGGSSVLYNQAAANTRLVGLEVAYLIEQLVLNFGAPIDGFHIIGHSLGAHIAGYTGERLQHRRIGKLGRISGLDPAEPLFQHMPEFVRIDPGDAEFVDVIHTDAKSILMFGYGMEQPVGHVDFYPNGGTDQPGCTLMDLPVNLTSVVHADRTADSVGRHLVACSHMRAVQLYIESLRTNQSCHMIGQECSTYEEYKLGLCFSCGDNGERCAPLGYHSIDYWPVIRKQKTENIRFYLDTGKTPDTFCQHHYLLEVNLAKPKKAERWVQGFLHASLYGSNKEVVDLELSKEESLQLSHGDSKRFLLTFSDDLGKIRIAHLKWDYDHELDPLNLGKVCVLLCSDHLYVRSLVITKLAMTKPHKLGQFQVQGSYLEETVEVCGDSSDKNYSDIRSGESKLFYKECSL